MKTWSFIWATVLPSLALSRHTRTFKTDTKCIYLDGEALCPGTTRVLTSDFVTIAAGFPPNSKSVAEWAPKWYETIWLRPRGALWPNFEYYDYSLGDDECVYTQILFNPTGLIKCVNLKYTYGDKVPNPWNTLNYGPDGPVDYSDPQHFSPSDGSWLGDREQRLTISNKLDEYDPEKKLLPWVDDGTRGALRDFVHGTEESRARNPVNRKPPNDDVIPPNPPPRLKDMIRPPRQGEADDAEQDASAAGSDGVDDSLFTDNPTADSGTPLNGVTASLDPSIFDKVGDNLFESANQADLSAFDPGASTTTTTSDIALGGNNDWTSALLPGAGYGNDDIFTADTSGGINNNNNDNLFAADDSAGANLFSGGGDLSFLDSPAGSAGDDIFSKRRRTTSPRDFRF